MNSWVSCDQPLVPFRVVDQVYRDGEGRLCVNVKTPLDRKFRLIQTGDYPTLAYLWERWCPAPNPTSLLSIWWRGLTWYPRYIFRSVYGG